MLSDVLDKRAREVVEEDGNEWLQFPRLEGILKKKTNLGIWKDRYCKLNDATFMTFKPKGVIPTSEIKENIDIKLIDSVNVQANGKTLEIRLLDNELLLFKFGTVSESEFATNIKPNVHYSHNVEVWQKAFSQRIDFWNQSKAGVKSTSTTVHISGWLMKKSNNKYQLNMQERYIRVKGNQFLYYKGEHEEKESGVINLETTQFIRPYDRSADCKVFEICNAGRIYTFQAKDSYEMKRWIDVVAKLLQDFKNDQMKNNLQKSLLEIPPRIRVFDNDGMDKFIQLLWEDINEIYPTISNESLSDNIDFAKQLHDYLDDFIPEVKKTATRAARYDCLAVFMVQVNRALSEKLLPVLDINSPAMRSVQLSDLHTTIEWITKYQSTIKRCYCPITVDSPIGKYLMSVNTTPYTCAIFEAVPSICQLYVNGDPKNGSDGTATHLVDHCIKVWNTLLQAPGELLQRHHDGSFFTHTPVDMWEALNQHLHLAASTQSPVLHVMVASKIAAALSYVANMIKEYVDSMDTKTLSPELAEFELEFLCALANDNALHIEEVISVVDNFELEEIRLKMDELFDPVTVNLVKCGQSCLRRLSTLICTDVQEQIGIVFTKEWVESSPIKVLTATLADYMADLEIFLMPFWTEKFVFILLEQVILRYTRTVLRAGLTQSSAGTSTNQSNTPAIQSKAEKTMSFFGIKSTFKDLVTAAGVAANNATGNTKYCRTDFESLGRLAQDVNILNEFFHQRAGQDVAAEFLSLINEVSIMLIKPLDELEVHVMSRIAVYPASAQAIYDCALNCLRLRDDVTTKEIREFKSALTQALKMAPIAADENAKLGIAEGRLGLLYADVNANEGFYAVTAGFLAQKLKDMTMIPLALLKQAIQDLNDDEIDDNDLRIDEETKEAPLSHSSATDQLLDMSNKKSDASKKAALLLRRRESIIHTSVSSELVDDVLDVIQQEDNEIVEIIKEVTLDNEAQEAWQTAGPGVITIEGNLEKKSPAHNLWQKRWFKLMTKPNPDEEDAIRRNCPHIYSLLWFKKRGGAAIKALDISSITCLAIVQCPRVVVFDRTKKTVILHSQVTSEDEQNMDTIIPEITESDMSSPTFLDAFVFSIYTADGKEHTLKTSKVDKMLIWLNALILVTGMPFQKSSSYLWTSSVEIPKALRSARRKSLIQPPTTSKSVMSMSSMQAVANLNPIAPINRALSAIVRSTEEESTAKMLNQKNVPASFSNPIFAVNDDFMSPESTIDDTTTHSVSESTMSKLPIPSVAIEDKDSSKVPIPNVAVVQGDESASKSTLSSVKEADKDKSKVSIPNVATAIALGDKNISNSHDPSIREGDKYKSKGPISNPNVAVVGDKDVSKSNVSSVLVGDKDSSKMPISNPNVAVGPDKDVSKIGSSIEEKQISSSIKPEQQNEPETSFTFPKPSDLRNKKSSNTTFGSTKVANIANASSSSTTPIIRAQISTPKALNQNSTKSLNPETKVSSTSSIMTRNPMNSQTMPVESPSVDIVKSNETKTSKSSIEIASSAPMSTSSPLVSVASNENEPVKSKKRIGDVPFVTNPMILNSASPNVSLEKISSITDISESKTSKADQHEKEDSSADIARRRSIFKDKKIVRTNSMKPVQPILGDMNSNGKISYRASVVQEVSNPLSTKVEDSSTRKQVMEVETSSPILNNKTEDTPRCGCCSIM